MLEVGGVFARAGLKVEEDGFREFDRRYDRAQRTARDDIKANAKLDTDHRGFDTYNRKLNDTERHADRGARTFGRLGKSGAAVGVAMGGLAAGGLAGVTLGLGKAISEFEDAAKVGAQTEAVIKSTGGSANVTASEVENLATKLSNKTAIDDEVIQSGANMLLTFTNIRNEAGKGNDVFNQATTILTDMSVALGTDANKSAIQLGKALNDPIKGVTALTRVGVTFTDQQKEQIAALVENGDKMGAQKIILRELNKEFGGSAEAQARPLERAKVAVNNLFEALGRKLAPTVTTVANAIADFVGGMEDGTGAGGRFADILRGVAGVAAAAGRWIGNAFDTIRSAFSGNDGAAGKWSGNVRRYIGAVVSFARGLWRSLSEIFDGIDGDLAIIGRAWLKWQGVVTGAMMAIARRVLPALKTAIEGLALIVRGVIRIIAGILSGDWRRVWNGAKDIVVGVAKLIWGAIRGITAPIREALSRIGGAVGRFLEGAFASARRVVVAAADRILGAVTSVLRGIGAMLDVGAKIPGLGKAFKGVGNEVDHAADKLDGLRESLRQVPEHKNVNVTVGIDLRPPSGIVSGGDGWGVESAIDASVRGAVRSGQINPFAAFGGSHAAGAVDQFNPLAGAFGLGVSSGYRPGAITSSGNLSYHALNRARDYADGPGSMLQFAQFMAAFLGGKLTELIHTPLGFSIKNGARVAPYAQADHYDHVHVALQRGGVLPGSRDGDLVPLLAEDGEGLLNRNAVRGLGGPRFVDWANARWPRFQNGGNIGATASRKPIPYKNVGMGEHFIAEAAHHVDELERIYTRKDRIFGRTSEDYIGEDADGKPTLDQKAVDRRKTELVELMRIRGKVRGWLREQLIATRRLIATIKRVVGHLRHVLKGLTGKKSEGRRGKIRDKIGRLTGRLDELKDQPYELGQAIKDAGVDYGDLVWEFDHIPSEAPAAPAVPTDGGDLGGADPGTAAPSAADVARAASAQVAAFNTARADLFGSFGSNFQAADGWGLGRLPADAVAREAILGAGLRSFGVLGSSLDGGAGQVGGRTVNIDASFGGAPPDPHTWARMMAFEAEAAFG